MRKISSFDSLFSRKTIPFLLACFFLAAGAASPALGTSDGVGEEAGSSPLPECIPAKSLSASLLQAARMSESITVEIEGLRAELVVEVAGQLPWTEANPLLGRPDNIAGERYAIFSPASEKRGTVTILVKCDYVWGKIALPDGRQAFVGETPSPPPIGHYVPVQPLPPAESSQLLGAPIPQHSGQHGSIEILKHIYNVDWTKRTDPVNVIFYDSLLGTIKHALDDEERGVAECNAGDDDLCDYEAEPGYCWDGDNKKHWAWFWDTQHQGEDKWWLQSEEYATQVYFNCFHEDRYHVRFYPSRAGPGDNHDPPGDARGFMGYVLAPVHRDNADGPDAGRTNLWSVLVGNHHITDWHLIDVQDNMPCENCHVWDGRVLLIEFGSHDSNNPEEGRNCPGGVGSSDWDASNGALVARGLHLSCRSTPTSGGGGNGGGGGGDFVGVASQDWLMIGYTKFALGAS